MNIHSKISDNLGKIPPQELDMEEAVLGAILKEKDAILEVASILKPEYFYSDKHRMVYQAITDLYTKSNPVDILTVTERLRQTGELEKIGGPFEITQLTNRVGTSAHIDFHARIIVDKYVLRETIKFANSVESKCFDSCESLDEVSYLVNSEVDRINNIIVAGNTGDEIKEVVKESVRLAKRRVDLHHSGKIVGVPTGFCELDNITSGWQDSDMIIIGARPSVGKTSVALHSAIRSASKGIPVAIFSLETSSIKISDRLLLTQTNDELFTAYNFRTGYLTDEDLSEVERAGSVISELPITVLDRPGMNLSYIRTTARILKNKGACGLIIVDYLQMIPSENTNKNLNRVNEVGIISRGLKQLAKELDVPVIALCQLNRQIENRSSGRPNLSDLRECGDIEADADLVIFIVRDREMNSGTVGELIIAKHRDGGLADIPFTCNESVTKFYDVAGLKDIKPISYKEPKQTEFPY
jgi:replicative DNA helicase